MQVLGLVKYQKLNFTITDSEKEYLVLVDGSDKPGIAGSF